MKYKKLILGNDETLTLPSDIKNFIKQSKHSWLLKAEIDDAVIEIKNDKVIWHMGTWYSGHWYGDIWKDGTWNSGHWHDGTWYDGLWRNGTWHKGTWKDGIYEKGDWRSGEKQHVYKY